MSIPFDDWMVLVGLLSFCAFVTFTVSQIQIAIVSYLEDDN